MKITFLVSVCMLNTMLCSALTCPRLPLPALPLAILILRNQKLVGDNFLLLNFICYVRWAVKDGPVQQSYASFKTALETRGKTALLVRSCLKIPMGWIFKCLVQHTTHSTIYKSVQEYIMNIFNKKQSWNKFLFFGCSPSVLPYG